jgi:hypothetical protein
MSTEYKPTLSSTLRLFSVSVMLFAATALAFASKGGGGGDKKKHQEFDNGFTPIHASSAFTLKRAPFYSGSMISMKPVTENHISLNVNITYQRGNTTLILPYNYQVNLGTINGDSRSNLQFLGVRIQLPH